MLCRLIAADRDRLDVHGVGPANEYFGQPLVDLVHVAGPKRHIIPLESQFHYEPAKSNSTTPPAVEVTPVSWKLMS